MNENRQKALWAAIAIVAGSLIITVPLAGLLGCSDVHAQQGRSVQVEKAPAKTRLEHVELPAMFGGPAVGAVLFRDTVSNREWIVFYRDKFVEVRDVTYPENDRCHHP
jgi:hypothetical protein